MVVQHVWLVLVMLVVAPIAQAFRKVVVQAVYKEKNVTPSLDLQRQYGFSVFSYQKLDQNEPHYFGYNRGTETGVYLKYIVDHYHDFPDVAIFVHAHPHEHQSKWMQMVGCISPNATWYNINYGGERGPWTSRDPEYWYYLTVHTHSCLFNKLYSCLFNRKDIPEVVEQCWRDIIQTLWELRGHDAEFHRRLPPTTTIRVSATCCNQFLVSKAMVHLRPLHVWTQLLHMVSMQPTCHEGPLDYEFLNEFRRTGFEKQEPEQPFYSKYGESADRKPGAVVAGGAGEHLSHVIFGHQPFEMKKPTQVEMCQNFIKGCPGSPCQ